MPTIPKDELVQLGPRVTRALDDQIRKVCFEQRISKQDFIVRALELAVRRAIRKAA